MPSAFKIAVVVSHPIQHFCPQYVSFAENENIDLKVFFGSALGYKKYVDVNFQEEIAWNNLNLDKFKHVFLNGYSVIQVGKNLDASTLEAELKIFGPDLVITYGYFQKLQRRARRWALKHNIPLAYISDAEGRQQRHVLKEKFRSIILRRFFKPIQYFLTVGDANESYYRGYAVPDEKMIRMHFPIDVKQYKEYYQERSLLRDGIRNQYGISGIDTVLCVVGKLVTWKNQDHIIDAMQVLEQKGFKTILFILGSGEKREEWEQKAAGLAISKVYFPGFVSIDDLPAYYAATDIYVHPASVEPHSIAVSEAIYMGCPVIISDRCGSYGDTDDVQAGKNGYVFQYGNIEQLAEKIALLATNKTLRDNFGAYSHDISVSFQKNAHYSIMEKLVYRLQSSINVITR